MRTIISCAMLALCISANGLAQDKKTVGSNLEQVTVFLKGAELTHTASAAIVRGENIVSIEGLSPSIDMASLKIKATGNAVISSYEFSVDYLSTGKASAPLIKRMEDSIAVCKASLDRVGMDLRINGDVSTLMQAGVNKNVSGSEAGMSVDELAKTMTYFKSKSEEMFLEKIALNKKKEQLQTTLKRLESQLSQESTKGNKTSGMLKLTLTCPAAVTSAFTISYYTLAASWVPYYDINVTSTDAPILISGKAKVQQTTGLDWEKVKLTLSTAMPSQGKVAPLFSAWFLSQQYSRSTANAMMTQNSYSYANEEVSNQLQGKLAGVSIRGMGTAEQSPEPLYVVNGVIATAEQVKAIDAASIKSMNVLKDGSATALYGSRAAGGVVVLTLKSEMDDYVTESENASSATYNIDLPYTIPGNGKVQNIDLLKKETPAEYKYYCAPKLDTETYLLAEITGWEKLGLLTGRANITYDGTYVGETMINASSTHEKLTLTLGTDKRIAVKREKVTDYSSAKLLGSDMHNVFTYRITVKNNQTKPIKMVIKDQYPITTQKSIEVTLGKETTPWTANKEDVGVITWEEEFAQGQTKTYQLTYSVKYPKDMNLNL